MLYNSKTLITDFKEKMFVEVNQELEGNNDLGATHSRRFILTFTSLNKYTKLFARPKKHSGNSEIAFRSAEQW